MPIDLAAIGSAHNRGGTCSTTNYKLFTSATPMTDEDDQPKTIGAEAPQKHKEKEPKELIVDAKPAPGDSSDGSGGAVAPIAISFAAAGLLAKFVAPWAGLVA